MPEHKADHPGVFYRISKRFNGGDEKAYYIRHLKVDMILD
jgi:hypothetical protein